MPTFAIVILKKAKKMETKEIPYGISDYARISTENYYYVDKTRFISQIEKAASFLFLIRPRHFGKSLLLSMLESYYDINNADRFEELYGNCYIFKNETRFRAKFLILRFDFSSIDSYPDRLESSFESYCRGQFGIFASKYEHLFASGFREELQAQPTAARCLGYINDSASLLGLSIYLLIDEYDNFTNTLLSTYGTEVYHKATHGDSFYRHFFAVVKAATGGSDRALKRMFITGVSPISMDDVTSGFNIGTNISQDFRFNGLVGFSETELREMLTYYQAEGKLKDNIETVIQWMKPWYDNYCFAKDTLRESMYNSDMALYFLNTYIPTGCPPDLMVDTNIKTDYNKIRHLVRIDKKLSQSHAEGESPNFSVIREIIETGQTTTLINRSFPADEITKPTNFKSLLYYFGLLTISDVQDGRPLLAVPNQTVREQMYTYLIECYRQAEVFTISLDHLADLTHHMIYQGEWRAVFTYIASELDRQSRIREFIDGEAHIKGFLLAYLGLTENYLLLPEYEVGKGYADFYFQPMKPGIKYAYLLEVKYTKHNASESEVEALKKEAREQLLKYAADPLVEQTRGNAELKLITVVFKAWELGAMEEVLWVY